MFLKSLIPLLLISQVSIAADYSIFEVRKSLPMENNEIAYKDYYINAGNESGLKKGMYLNVFRSSTMLDPAKNIAQGSLKIPIAKLQIIQVDKNIAVGRIATQTSNDERPSVEFEGVMIGDKLDMESASMEAPIVKSKRKTASVEEDYTPQAVAIPAKALAAPPTQVKAPAPAKNASVPEMVKVAVPPPQSSNPETKKNENI